MPTYNRAELLRQQLNSLVVALKDIPAGMVELIIRNNASPDHTEEVIESFKGKLPITYSRNDENIGVIRNTLKVTESATGEYLWMIGDDDLVCPDGIRTIISTFKNNPDLDGIIVTHAIALETKREQVQKLLNKGVIGSIEKSLVKSGVKNQFLPSLEYVYPLADVAGSLNFMANVALKTRLWLDRLPHYTKICNARDQLCDVETNMPYYHIWAEALVGKRVYLLAEPQIIAFLGAQLTLSRWDTILTCFFLNFSKYMLQLGADPECVRVYQHKILSLPGAFARQYLSDNEYTRNHFSISHFIRGYGEQPVLWSTFLKVYRTLPTAKMRKKFAKEVTSAAIVMPKAWPALMRVLMQDFGSIIKRQVKLLLHGKKAAAKNEYSAKAANSNNEATRFFRMTVDGAPDANVKHPLYLKNQQYLSVGQRFNSGPGLRVEALEKYRGQTFSPKIKIGNRVSFNFNCHLGAIDSIEIGDDVLVGSNVLITDHLHGNPHGYLPGKTYAEQPLFSKGPVIIGNNVLIGENVCIMPGVTIGTNCVIGANTVVTKDVPDNAIAAGSPARVIRRLGE
jgi:acetyltransferase-like isoleucine patch superfamily enzyme